MNDSNLDANNVRFLGTVSQITCNLVPYVNGSATNVVNVGLFPLAQQVHTPKVLKYRSL